jgi:hypothetical protein
LIFFFFFLPWLYFRFSHPEGPVIYIFGENFLFGFEVQISEDHFSWMTFEGCPFLNSQVTRRLFQWKLLGHLKWATMAVRGLREYLGLILWPIPINKIWFKLVRVTLFCFCRSVFMKIDFLLF